MVIVLFILGATAVAYIAAKFISLIQFRREVKQLFAQSKPNVDKKFNYTQLVGLPEPVQRYFKLVLKDGQPYINSVRMRHDGQFKAAADKDWLNINGEQYATTDKPGFIWKGTTTMFTARDMYIDDKGRLVVTLFSIYNVINDTGKSFDQGELLRWLGESVLYPTNLLPSDKLQWSSIDSQTSKFTFNYQGLSLFYTVSFNEAGEITQLETKRFMDEKNLETWIIKLTKYKAMNNVLIPTAFEVLWRLDTGDLTYAKFNLKKIEYNRPEVY